jgi:hypothetical protein
LLDQRETIHVRHVKVGQNQGKGALLLFQAVQGGDPALCQRGLHPEAPQHLPQDATVGGTVIHYQRTQAS